MDVGDEIICWQMGSTWRTLFPTKAAAHQCSNPRNAEFAIQVAEPTEMDALYRAFVEAGAMEGWDPPTQKCMGRCDSLALTIHSVCELPLFVR